MRISGEILQTVDGNVGETGQDDVLDFTGEDPHPAEAPERTGQIAVADGRDVQQFDIAFRCGGSQQRCDVLGLPQGKPAGTGGNFEKTSAAGRGHV